MVTEFVIFILNIGNDIIKVIEKVSITLSAISNIPYQHLLF